MIEVIGLIFTLNAIFTWAIASLVYKSGLERVEPKASLFFRLCCVTLGTFMFSLIFGNYVFLIKLSKFELTGYLISCIISGLSVTIGDLFYYMSLKKIDASRAYPLVQISLIFVFPLSVFLFGETLKLSVLFGSILFLVSVFILSSKDKSEKNLPDKKLKERISEEVITGVFLALGAAFLWALSIVSFNQARLISGDVFVTNFVRVSMTVIPFSILGLFRPEYFRGFKKKKRENLKFYVYIGIAGILSLGFADTLFYKAIEINGLVLTSAITANTPMVQQIFSILFLKEKVRKRFLIAVGLLMVGNYLVLFL